jgi:acyl-coenzyme A synthetase/AMP-(fatty) acid ligase
MPPPGPLNLAALLGAAHPSAEAGLRGVGGFVAYRDIAAGTSLGSCRDELAGRSVLLAVASQLASARLLLELDGVAARVVIVPPDFTVAHMTAAAGQANADVVVHDDSTPELGLDLTRVGISALSQAAPYQGTMRQTEWVLPTSGTTGAPKLVAHLLPGLLGAVRPRRANEALPVWATFYDIRRYGGMQIFLRAATSGVTLVVTEPDEPLADHVARMAAAGVTHLSGTPSHWRRLLMSPHAKRISPRYVRLSGEIADRAILDSLKTTYPEAAVVHAYASTEAGVGFEVTDGQEGFPASYLDGVGEVEMRVIDGSLRLRSSRIARCYIGRDDLAVSDADGFVDTDDMVERRGDRFYFLGRRAGIINVGGLKVHPEEVEQVINQHDAVRMSLVKARRSPITGDLIVADVVLKTNAASEQAQVFREEILANCRARLDRHKAPVMINFVPALDLQASGKLKRRHA